MQRTWRLIVAFGAGIAGFVSGLPSASAQDVSAPGGYQFLVTPYLWLASVHTTTLTPLAREPQVNSNVSTIDLLSHLNGAPFMGSFEVRYGSLGFLADAIYLPVSTKITTHESQGRHRRTAPESRSIASSKTRCSSPMPALAFV